MQRYDRLKTDSIIWHRTALLLRVMGQTARGFVKCIYKRRFNRLKIPEIRQKSRLKGKVGFSQKTKISWNSNRVSLCRHDVLAHVDSGGSSPQNWGCNVPKGPLWSSRLPIPTSSPRRFMKLSNVNISLLSYCTLQANV